ncbi:MAG: hypothetical protein HC862_01605 [Scytonema sp. RU_4_4]|nr:hypothetical protein [Scytonema sp. RU_4_4]
MATAKIHFLTSANFIICDRLNQSHQQLLRERSRSGGFRIAHITLSLKVR